MGKKTLEELVFHDDFMFAAVMRRIVAVFWNVCWKLQLKRWKSAQSIVSYYLQILRGNRQDICGWCLHGLFEHKRGES